MADTTQQKSFHAREDEANKQRDAAREAKKKEIAEARAVVANIQARAAAREAEAKAAAREAEAKAAANYIPFLTTTQWLGVTGLAVSLQALLTPGR